MSIKVYSVEEIRDILNPIFAAYGVNYAALFGSYAKGKAHNDSDIDIYVESGLKGLAFFGLLEDVSESLDKQVDLIDASQIVPNSRIDKEIKKTGVAIYES